MFDIETNWGQIHFSKKPLRQICTNAVELCGGKAVIYNFKGKGRNKGEVVFQPRSDKATAADILIEGDGSDLEITMYIVVRFGASIKGVARTITDSIHSQLKDVFGVTPARVKIIITGTASKDVITRHIEFTRTAEGETIEEQ